MKSDYANRAERSSMNIINSTRKMCGEVLTALQTGQIDKNLGLSLLSYGKEQLKTAYNQRIELLTEMKLPYDKVEQNKYSELESLDRCINNFLEKGRLSK